MVLNVPFVPPNRSTSSASKPVTSSENVNVTMKSFVEVIHSGIPIVTVGAVSSHFAVAVASCTGTVFTPSVAASCHTVNVTSFEPSGITTSL